MRVTRSQAARSAASTPIKNEQQQSLTESRSTRRRTRPSTTPDASELIDSDDQVLRDNDDAPVPPPQDDQSEQKEANGSANNAHPKTDSIEDHRVDRSGHFEFGGPVGVTLLMTIFPLLMWYMWIGATYYDGQFPVPDRDQSITDFIVHLGRLVYQGAFPTLQAWTIYWTFIVFEVICYIYLPGMTTLGKPLAHEGGRQLEYHCSGLWSFYTTIAVAAGLHFTGLFPLYTLLDEFGPLLSVSIISGCLVSIVAYVSALYRGAEHRMSGNLVYDFFMGAELNPRMFGILDFKMFFEVRLPWYMLFLITAAAVARQYEQFGYVSGEVLFLLMAHFLYANACSKGEEYIPPTWDMYYEKWGFMLIFWNMAGVPLSYCHCTIHLANHAPSTYRWNRAILAFLFSSYLFMYWIWDTTGSQKSRFKQMEHGGTVQRNKWIELPWQTLKNPQTITSEKGDKILVDGWYKYARKIHYTCDFYFALCWGLITGFDSPLPWFYPVFFALMIAHRAYRDIQRCEEKYGEAWQEYKRRVPWLFIPYVF